jgi:hypothetical protein
MTNKHKYETNLEKYFSIPSIYVRQAVSMLKPPDFNALNSVSICQCYL